jgi:hypothetical protein
MTSAAPPTEFFPGINFNASFYNLGQSAVTLDYLNSNFLRSTGYAISRAQFTLFNGTVDINENLDVSGNINASAYLLNGVPFTPSQWTTSVNDIYYTTGNVGIGKTNPTYKLDVSGNVNCNAIFTNGTQLTQYTDANVRTVLGTSAGTNMTWNTGTNKFDVSVVFPPSYTDTNTRTVLSNSAGTNMTWNTGTNKFDVAAPYTLPTAGTGSGGTLGGVKVDGTTISVNATTGVISRTGNTILLNATTVGESYGWTGLSSGLFRVGTNGQYSTGSLVEDIVLRSNGDVLLQSGIGNYGLRINTSNNILMRNAVGVGSTAIAAGFNLDVTGNVTMRNAACIGSTAITSGFAFDVSGNVTMRNAACIGKTSITSGFNLDVFGDVVIGNSLSIGTTSILASYGLNVSANIITSGNIALANASRSIFWTGTNSNLARAGVAGEYSTSAAINDIVLRSGNKLILQSGTGAAGIVIDTANNIGIGTTNPSNAKVVISGTSAATGLDLSTADQYAEMRVIRNSRFATDKDMYLQYQAGTNSSMFLYANNNQMMIIRGTGVNIGTNVWHGSLDGLQRAYYEASSTTYLRGHGGTPFVFRNGADSDLVNITSGGNVGIGKTPGYKLDVNGEINATNVRVNGVDINQMIKNQHLFSIYRVSITNYYLNFISYWEGVWDIETNLKFNEYGRPQLNVRWNISASINNGNGNDSNKYFFMNYFYNQLGNNIAFNTTHSYGTWSFQNYWGPYGNNYLRVTCRLDAAADYLNVNIS